MLSGSFPIFALSNHTTFSQTQTGATVPLKTCYFNISNCFWQAFIVRKQPTLNAYNPLSEGRCCEGCSFCDFVFLHLEISATWFFSILPPINTAMMFTADVETSFGQRRSYVLRIDLVGASAFTPLQFYSPLLDLTGPAALQGSTALIFTVTCVQYLHCAGLIFLA